jgi:hypothetical protein
MPVRLGIELSPVSCRYVELDSSHAAGRAESPARVRSYGRLSRGGVGTLHELSKFQGQPAAAVVWGLQADHRYAVVPHGSFRSMRRDAVTSMQGSGVETRGRVADIFAAPRAKGAPTRSVVVALAATPGLVSATQWLSAQGIRLQSAVTPALALMSLARLRGAFSVPDRIEAYVALEETSTAVALVRNGLLLAASELAWGYQNDRGVTRSREEIARRLADDIEGFLAARSARPDVLAQVCICGGLPDLRSMAIRLMEELDVEVEPLDSLFGIDAVHLPGPENEFRERAADFRLAWAAAADWPAPVNLLRERKRRLTKTILTRAAVAAGVATGVGVAWQVQRSDWWRSTPSAPNSAPARAASFPRAASSPAAVAPVRTSPRPAPPPPVQVRPAPLPALSARAQPAAVPPATVPPRAVPSPIVQAPPAPPLVPRPAVQPPAVRPRPVPPVQPPVVQRRDEPPPARVERQPASDRRLALPPPEIALPFDAVLGTILYAPERQLAIIDGRIVQAGDEINGARVVDITPTAVLLRDAQGRLRRLGLGASVR